MTKLPPKVPRRHGAFSRRLAAVLLRLLGWRVAGSVPDVAKCVVIAVPHTSNFDGLYVLPAMLALDLKISILGKKSLFAVPGLAAFLRWAGVIPLDREHAGGVVDEAVAQFGRSERLFLGISPEGTRHAAPKWKSGYWRIARGANVPVLPVALTTPGAKCAFCRCLPPLPIWPPTMPRWRRCIAAFGRATRAACRSLCAIVRRANKHCGHHCGSLAKQVFR